MMSCLWGVCVCVCVGGGGSLSDWQQSRVSCDAIEIAGDKKSLATV